MSMKRAEIISGYRPIVASALVAFALCFGLAGRGAAQADAPPPKQIDARAVIGLLSDALAQGRRDTLAGLSRLGFDAEVKELSKQGDKPLYAFSAQTIIENLYRRAEVQKQGEGDRFLAVLYHKVAAPQSAALAADPDLKHLREFAADTLDIKARPIKFSSLQEISDVDARRPLPKIADRAIMKLSEVYAGRGLAQARVAVLRHFRKEGFDGRAFEQALADTKTTEEALRRMVSLGTPPPPTETALCGVLHDTIAGSAALSVDRGALEIMDELSRDLPAEVERYIKVEDQLESRKLQKAEAAKIKRLGKERPNEAPILIGTHNGNDEPFDPPLGPQDGSPSSGGGSGGGGGGKTEFASAYENYNSETFQSRTPLTAEPRSSIRPSVPTYSRNSTGTPRGYEVAIHSASAARGIALGGEVTSEIKEAPVHAVWLANSKDDRFGRLFVQFSSVKGRSPLVGASRVLFADSFYAASSILWGKHGDEASFRDGEILVLMSMDPKSPASRDAQRDAQKLVQRELLKKLDAVKRKQAEKALEDLETVSAQADAGDQSALIRRITLQETIGQLLRPVRVKLGHSERKKLEQSVRRLLAIRGVVTHPAIFGRELAWSAIRIDFGFNRMDRIRAESVMMNGGHPMPLNLKNLPLSKAETWQFFEQDSLIRLGDAEGHARRLEVISKPSGKKTPLNPSVGARSHFGISMFGESAAPGAQQVEDGLYRLEDLETQIQPQLDWLATNHHDYMRLNDLSEAFSLLRWLRSTHVEIIVMDMNGQNKAIATPDRVEIGYGPRVGVK